MSDGLGSRTAPEASPGALPAAVQAPARTTPSYAQALCDWRSPEDLSAWAGQHFRFDAERALALSSTRRQVTAPPPIAEPAEFHAAPVGVCLDLARFSVETLRRIEPQVQARYLMLEFDPVMVDGHLLRLHWIATFRRDGQLFFFADSDRPGHVAGPYACIQAFVDDYAVYRGQRVVRFVEMDSFQRQPPRSAAAEACEATR